MIEMLHHSPMGEIMGIRDDESTMMLHNLRRMVERYLPEVVSSTRTTTSTTTTATGKGAKGKPKPTE